MRRFFLLLILLGVSVKYGMDYLLSPAFQEYGDRTQAAWTCRVNNFFGAYHMTISNYEAAARMFRPVLKRCPKGRVAEDAAFRLAICLEKVGARGEAIEAYKAFAEDFPDSKRAPVATRAASVLRH